MGADESTDYPSNKGKQEGRVTCREPYEKLKKGLKRKMILNQLKNIPKLYNRSRTGLLRKYLEIWYINAIEIPDEMANKIQNADRGHLGRTKFGKLQKLEYILRHLLLKNISIVNDKKLATLSKWNKNARLLKCGQDARIIQRFCRKIHYKYLKLIREEWKNLAINIMTIRINNLLRRILKEWLNKAKKLIDIDNNATTEDLVKNFKIKLLKEEEKHLKIFMNMELISY